MKNQFTPGPWVVGVNKNTGRPATEVWAHSEALCVASGFGDGPESEANAQLIASAPELLAACEHALDTFGGVRPSEWAVASRAEFDLLTTAIAKARGGGK